MLLSNSLNISHEYIEKIVKPGDIVIDATAGKGNDTLFLAKLVGENGHVYSFDIQKEAIHHTQQKLASNGLLNRVSLILDGHENMDKYITHPVKAIMFNLGYLPGGDHSIKTKGETTTQAITKGLELLQTGGIITIVIYYGKDTGFDEKEKVLSFVKTLDWQRYTVLVHEFVNQINCPPIAVIIEKK